MTTEHAWHVARIRSEGYSSRHHARKAGHSMAATCSSCTLHLFQSHQELHQLRGVAKACDTLHAAELLEISRPRMSFESLHAASGCGVSHQLMCLAVMEQLIRVVHSHEAQPLRLRNVPATVLVTFASGNSVRSGCLQPHPSVFPDWSRHHTLGGCSLLACNLHSTHPVAGRCQDPVPKRWRPASGGRTPPSASRPPGAGLACTGTHCLQPVRDFRSYGCTLRTL